MSVRQAETAARNILEGKKIAPKQDKDPNTVAFEQALQEALGTKVEVKENGNGKGTLTLHFNTYEELNVLGDKLKTLV